MLPAEVVRPTDQHFGFKSLRNYICILRCTIILVPVPPSSRPRVSVMTLAKAMYDKPLLWIVVHIVPHHLPPPESLASPEFLDLPRILGICSKRPEFCPEILDKFEWLSGEENWGFWAILGKNLTVSSLNMTQYAIYHLNKV